MITLFEYDFPIYLLSVVYTLCEFIKIVLIILTNMFKDKLDAQGESERQKITTYYNI